MRIVISTFEIEKEKSKIELVIKKFQEQCSIITF